MKWYEITIDTSSLGTEIVYAVLDAIGISNVRILEDAAAVNHELKSVAKYWDYVDGETVGQNPSPAVVAYVLDDYEGQKTVEKIRGAINALKAEPTDFDLGSLEISINNIADEDWENNWKQYYKPFPVGEKLFITPAWEETQTDGIKTVLRLDPGLAFGTGSHETTMLCLKLLERAVKPSYSMLDLGCGSGILFIAALLLGAENAVAADIDPIVRDVVRRNAELNGIDEKRYMLHIGNILQDENVKALISAKKYDVICANIVADVLIMLAPAIYDLLSEKGCFIGSGIIKDRLEDVKSAFSVNRLKILVEDIKGEWCALMCGIADNA